MTFPELPDSEVRSFEDQRMAVMANYDQGIVQQVTSEKIPADNLSPGALQLKAELRSLDGKESEQALKHSVAGRIGTSLESISSYAGFDWRTNIALVGGFAAKEVIVSALGTAYSLGEVDAADSASLSETLAANPGWNKATALALIIFVMFYSPCFVTVVCIVREAGSWKWGLFSMAFNTVLAFILAVTVYQVASGIM